MNSRLIAAAMACLALAGCAGEEHQDLKEWMTEATKDFKGRVPPLPEIKPFPVVAYETADLVDPFRASKIEPDKRAAAGAGGLQPDFDRRKEPLEAFPLESLKMVGVLEQGKLKHAVILAGKSVYQVKIGNYMGQNFGIITNITDNDVQLRELVQDSSGVWTERTSALELQVQEARK